MPSQTLSFRCKKNAFCLPKASFFFVRAMLSVCNFSEIAKENQWDCWGISVKLESNFTEMAAWRRSSVNAKRIVIQLIMRKLAAFWARFEGPLQVRREFGTEQPFIRNGSRRRSVWPPVVRENDVTATGMCLSELKNVYTTEWLQSFKFYVLSTTRTIYRLELCQKLHSKNQKFGCFRFKKH